MTARRCQTNLFTTRVKEKHRVGRGRPSDDVCRTIIIVIIITIISLVFKWVLGTSTGARLLYHLCLRGVFVV